MCVYKGASRNVKLLHPTHFVCDSHITQGDFSQQSLGWTVEVVAQCLPCAIVAPLCDWLTAWHSECLCAQVECNKRGLVACRVENHSVCNQSQHVGNTNNCLFNRAILLQLQLSMVCQARLSHPTTQSTLGQRRGAATYTPTWPSDTQSSATCDWSQHSLPAAQVLHLLSNSMFTDAAAGSRSASVPTTNLKLPTKQTSHYLNFLVRKCMSVLVGRKAFHHI